MILWFYENTENMQRKGKHLKESDHNCGSILFLMIATSSRTMKQQRTGWVSLLCQAQPSCVKERTMWLGSCPGVSLPQPQALNSWNNILWRPECVWTLVPAFPLHIHGTSALPWDWLATVLLSSVGTRASKTCLEIIGTVGTPSHGKNHNGLFTLRVP